MNTGTKDQIEQTVHRLLIGRAQGLGTLPSLLPTECPKTKPLLACVFQVLEHLSFLC